MFNTLKFIVDHPLNKRQKIPAIRRWLNWQIGSRLVPGPVAVKFVNDTMLLVAPGMTGATGNVYAGLHEFHDMGFALHLLRPGDFFVDVGANVGVYTVLAAAVGASTLSIEPAQNAFRQLLLNIQLNDFGDRADTRCLGIGSEKGSLKFTMGLDTTNHVVDGHEAAETDVCEVEVDTLDNIVGKAHPVLIKIDVEGFETEVIAGAEAVLSNETVLAVIMELNGSGQRYDYDEGEVYGRMIALGFAPYSYDPQTRSLVELPGKNRQGGNTLFIRNAAEVRERLRTAPAFTVMGQTL